MGAAGAAPAGACRGHGAREGLPRRQPAREPAARTYAGALPVVPVRARGLTIEGADGRRYLDCLSGDGTLALGHNHPAVLEAIRKVLDSGAPLHAPGLATPVRDAFVAELLRTLPPGLADRARVRFCGPTGAEAMATAVGLVRAATGRTDVLGFGGAGAERFPGAAGAPGPCEGPEAPEAAGATVRDRARRMPAGVVLEPVRCEDGTVPVPEAWLRRVRRLTADRPVALIADETRTGAGRTGAFWAVEHSGVVPDVMVLARAVGGSLPLGVVVHRDDLGPPEPGAPADAFRGNQLAMAAGTATLAHIRENRLADRAAELGARLMGRLRELAEESACLGEVRGRGLMIGVEVVDPEGRDAGAGGDAGAAAGGRPAAAVRRECLRRGLIVGLGGRHTNVVRLLPPLTITDEQAAAVLDRLADAVRTVTRARTGHAEPRRRTRPARRRR
ncbi:aminotransferase class III-fold pyridoxal phosphate-dependent enzyme [Streptomyces glaucus]|uniref:aminotransferase class III-fold pyridoxal phosphate-dependent enzyme n=1 Tax=Streptomyces glaucus TaxID=284029 RepID=UPI0031E0C295